MRVDTAKWSPDQQQLWGGLSTQKKAELSEQGPERALSFVKEQLNTQTMHLRGTVGAGKMTGRSDKIRSPNAEASPAQGADASLSDGLQKLLSSAHLGVTNAVKSVAAAIESATAPPLQPLTIGGSVGAGGANRPEDVTQVQQALSRLGVLPEGFTPGQIDQATTDAITRYQEQNGLPFVDGRIDVSKSTMRHINRRIDAQTPGQPRQPTAPGGTSPQPMQPQPLGPGGTTPQPVTPQPVGPGGTLPQPGEPQPIGPGGMIPTGPAAGVSPANDARLQEIQQRSVASAQGEWQAGVRESGGSNRGERIDEYARTARMRPGGEWCGYFTGFNYANSGFRHTSSLASYQKARDFFMYRSYTKSTGDPANDRLDQLRTDHQANGDGRQYFMLQESPNIRRTTRNGSWGNQRYGHYDAAANTFDYQNIPVRGGDTVLFHRGHVGMVESYNPQTGHLTTIEGNTSGEGPDGRRRSQAVVRKTYDLTDPQVRAQFDGFGRPAAGDFDPA